MSAELRDLILLCLSSAAAGAINAVAGGGTLLTFPMLFAVLGDSAGRLANATSTTALFPGTLATIAGYRGEVVVTRRWIFLLLAPSILGGAFGAWLLTAFSESSFAAVLPWLILLAASLFALQPTIARWTGIGRAHEPPTRWTAVGVILFQLAVAIYGGYFGAGIGILMLSALAMMGMADIHEMNAVKAVLGALINGIAVIVFVIDGMVVWRLAVPMAIAALVSGYVTARVARRLNRTLVRGFVTGVGFVLAATYFYRQWNDRPLAPADPPAVQTVERLDSNS